MLPFLGSSHCKTLCCLTILKAQLFDQIAYAWVCVRAINLKQRPQKCYRISCHLGGCVFLQREKMFHVKVSK